MEEKRYNERWKKNLTMEEKSEQVGLKLNI